MKRVAAIAGLGLLLLSRLVVSASAHPHVWVTMHAEVQYGADGRMFAIRHTWAFDDMFSTYALQGIAHARKGQYTREELKPLAKVNVTSLKEFDFFTYAKADGRKAVFADPVDYWLDYNDSILTLHFTLPLKTPVAAKTMLIEVYDPTIFVDFELAKDKPVTLSGAPPQCRLSVGLPHQPTAAEQLRLSQLDANPLDPSDTYGEMFANKIQVQCP
ncbi:DUF1007 family protein [Xanthobacteraceae bacterium Astr-EGSB]|uniref:DUF1007 family protein n=1 Tax=Astrobacterium formosum TaxID=3069710 RepID=UPI0027B406F7|nr:DUF1007 family protein [Xanthobacteraceae bacterium Astr-EGSB]